jgi:GBP family porin
MKKKLLAVAVAGALAAPGVALAQSSVTISGIFKVSLENLRIGSPAAGRAGLNTTENRVADDSSRILFNVVEDLGGGLQAIGQVDLRIPMASGNLVGASGNTHVGLRSASLGRVIIGRQDVHYGNTESDLTVLAGDLRADSISLLAYMANGVAIANATRTSSFTRRRTSAASPLSLATPPARPVTQQGRPR